MNKRPMYRVVYGVFDIGILQHDERRRTPKFHDYWLEVASAGLGNFRSHKRRTYRSVSAELGRS
jgi:hypothetical protein